MRTTAQCACTHFLGAEEPSIVLNRIQPNHESLPNAERQEEQGVPGALTQKDGPQEVEHTYA